MDRKLIIYPGMKGLEPEHGRDNINGPSLIRVPDWVENPLGKYYLYFAHHQGTYIRLAYSDTLDGPWTIYAPGVLRLENTVFRAHIASPDLHVDNENRRLVMFFHGPYADGERRGQFTAMAKSADGLDFTASDRILGPSYFRVFQWNGTYYASSFSNILRSDNWEMPFAVREKAFFPWPVRHTAVKLDGDTMEIFQSRYGDTPERIMVSRVELTPDWNDWSPSEPITVLTPENEFEGAGLPIEPSVSGAAHGRVHQLRDPAIYREGDRSWLLYSVAGESGIAIAEWKEM